VILKIAYGYSIDYQGTDPLIDLAEEAMDQFSLAVQPGKWLVDMLPICLFPLLLPIKVNKVNRLSSKTYPGLVPRRRFPTNRPTLPETQQRPGGCSIRVCAAAHEAVGL
jgi:hypothetical protein